jgi:hypothetical protein
MTTSTGVAFSVNSARVTEQEDFAMMVLDQRERNSG